MANRVFQELTGYAEEELKDLSESAITPADYHEEDAERLKLLQQAGQCGPCRKEYQRQDGSRLPVVLNCRRSESAPEVFLFWSFVQPAAKPLP